MGRLVRLIGSGIGLASEAIASRKAEKAEKAAAASARTQPVSEVGESSETAAHNQRAPANDRDTPPQYAEVSDSHAEILVASGKAVLVDEKEVHKINEKQQEDEDTASEEGDEEQWYLDDAVEAQLSHTPSEDEPVQDANVLLDAFMRSHPPPAYTPGARSQLPCPVILPQRRPRDKKRGFVRAYAPVLEDCGIDQNTFLDFLKTFHAASKSSPWLQVINIAAAGAGFVPNPIAMGVSIAVQFAVGVAMELQARTRSNTFLDRMNNEFFKPRGLYCLILTYKPEASSSHASVDITKAISNYDGPASSSMKQNLRNIRLSSGKTYGELEMPEAAPLIFPALDALQDSTSADAIQKQNKLKSSQKFVADYFDRRAQARYAAENPTSSLAAAPQEKQFASRYADPNHPANSGSLVSLITGGALDLKGRRDERRAGKRFRRARRRGYEIGPQTGKRKEGLVKRMLKKDVLYLMIVNLPSEEELAAGKASVANESK